MFKTILVLLFLFINNLSFSQIRQGKITYHASIDKEALIEEMNKSKGSPEMKNRMLQLVENATDINFTLLFNNEESLFYKEVELQNEGAPKMNMTEFQSGSSTIYYTNLKSGEKFFQSNFFSDLLVEFDIPKWTLTPEKKTIENYICYKATASYTVEGRNGTMKRSIEAWYSPEIPTSHGVQRFISLPGLILELSTSQNISFKAVKIKLNPEEKIEIKKPKGKIISSKEFNDMMKEANRR